MDILTIQKALKEIAGFVSECANDLAADIQEGAMPEEIGRLSNYGHWYGALMEAQARLGQSDAQIAPDAQDFYDEAEYCKAVTEWECAHPVVLTDDSTDAAIEWVHNTDGQGQQMSYNEWKNQGYSQEDIPPGI